MAGRPKLDEDNRRTKGIRVRLNEKEYEALSKLAQKEHTTMSKLIRNKMVYAIIYDFERAKRREESGIFDD